MESVFVIENPMDINLFVSECNEVQKLKLGEIYQMRDNTLSICCVHCLQEFQYFTEFSLHIQEHFVRNEVTKLKEINDDSSRSYENSTLQYADCDKESEVKMESDLFDKEFDLANKWCEEDLIDNKHSIFEPEINVESFERLPKSPSFVEGTDYDQINGKYRCSTCNHETAQWEHFKDHLMTHSNVRNVLCPLCSKAFAAVSYVRKHVNRTHKMKITADKIREAQPSFNSAIIVPPATEAKSFVEGEDFEKSNGRFKCLTCGREMLDHVKEHLLTHSNEKNVFCPICEKTFIAVSYVRKHVNRAHKMKITAEEIKSAQSSFNIPREDKNRTRKNVLTSVARCPNRNLEKIEKYFECFVCHRQFTSLSSLRIHQKLHSGIKYACPHCNKVFAMRSYVRDHIVAIHGLKRDEIPKDSIQQATTVMTSGSQQNNELFDCNLCHNQYTKKQTLRQHMKTHTSGPFLCVTCGSVVKSLANLRYHMERHQADPNKRHKCNICEKTYPTLRYMQSHFRHIHLNRRERKKPKKSTEMDSVGGALPKEHHYWCCQKSKTSNVNGKECLQLALEAFSSIENHRKNLTTKMESVFVGESLIDINQLTSNGDNQFNKLKIGEIYQMRDNTLSMCCTHCLQEFQYFTEFSLHIEEHYLRGEIARLSTIKEEIETEVQTPDEEELTNFELPPPELLEVEPDVKCEVNQYENDGFFDYDSDFAWSNHDDQSSLVDENESMQKIVDNLHIRTTAKPEPVPLIKLGTDYEKVDDKFKCLTCNHVTAKLKHFKDHVLTHRAVKHVECPICQKLFANVSYVRKHLNRTHRVKMTGEKIRQAQPSSNEAEAIDSALFWTNPAAPALCKSEPQRKTYTETKSFVEGEDYKKSDDKFECLTCNRKMVKWDHMKEHLLTHTSEKNVFCPICARAFITESYVRKHVNRTHKQKITAEEIKAAQSGIDISQTKEKWMVEREKKIAKQAKLNRPNATTATTEKETIRCLDCARRFTKPRYAQKHMRLIHAKVFTINELMSGQSSIPNIADDDGDCDDDENDDEINLRTDDDPNMEITDNKEIDTELGKNFECYECHKRFVRSNSLRIHMKLHSGIKFSCPYCGKVFALKSYVRDHIVIMHGIKRGDIPKEIILQASGNYIYNPQPNIEAYECYLCRNQYRKRNRLREHMNSHISGPYLCVICGAVYKSTDTLRHHMEKHKANGVRYECTEPDCGKSYPTRRYMLSHYRTIHLNKRRKRTAVAKKRTISCEICGQTFVNQHNLRMHMTVHDRNPDELTCNICGWEFKERGNLRQHMESHGNNKTNCNICNKVLSIRYMAEHLRIHTGNKEHQCATCGKQFVSRERLKRHNLHHTAEPKFKCDLCDKAYTRSDKLLYHRRSHDQQMTHTCQKCNKGFLTHKSLRKHENQHYLEE
ncbi:zinc finger protein 845-like, partial [Contarinia nasturtii]|uniref:zinc finger protein 845-like n=1 Tax=Contarinia nasturtii TaxID=265458 RepID=UPI0012D3BF10